MRRAFHDNDHPSETAPDDSGEEARLLPDRPSKSALKRQMHDLQALGQELSELPESRVDKLELPEALRDALAEYRRTRSHEGRRRQLQFVGKLMRQADEASIREAVAAYKLGSAKETLALHEAERWREELLADDDAVTRWLSRFPETDAQQLRSLVRAARKDAKAEAPEQRRGRSYRELFQLVKSALAVGSSGSADDPGQEEDNDE
jgi:ribosome-associated protein